MKLTIHHASISDNETLIDVRTWYPTNPQIINHWIVIAIGSTQNSKQGSDNFTLKIATPLGLQAIQHETMIIATRPLLVVSEYDGNVL